MQDAKCKTELRLRSICILHFAFCIVVIGQSGPGEIDVRIGAAPLPVAAGDGNDHLGYELHITNRRSAAVRLDRLDVSADGDGPPLLTYNATDLEGRVVRPGADPKVRYSRSIDAGARVLVHVWLTSAKGQGWPRALRHRLLLTSGGAEESVEGGRIDVATDRPIALGPPMRGGNWLVHNGPGNHRSPHWGSVLDRNDRLTVPQRFAVDWIGLDENGRAVRGDFKVSKNEDWVGFGAEVVAVHDGVVRDMRDGAADHAPFVEPPPPASVTFEAVGGNYVLLELSPNLFAYYAHFQRNTVAVERGQRVVRGQVLGRLGNSGNTNAPHLHLHLGDTAAFDTSEGVPFVFASFELLGETTAERALGVEASGATPALVRQRRAREMPLHGMVVRFP